MSGCTQLRRMLVKHGTLNIVTGDTDVTSEEWVELACDAPLFGDEERKRGTCRSCAAGWTHEHNYPVAPHGSAGTD